MLKIAHTIWFDGGCKRKEVSGGFLLFGPSGMYLGGEAKFYGSEANMNNKAENRALIDGI